jgi:hypothetical protein
MQNRFEDMHGFPLLVGDTVARAVNVGRSAQLKICEITRIENGRVYLNDSKVALNYPSRLLKIC